MSIVDPTDIKPSDIAHYDVYHSDGDHSDFNHSDMLTLMTETLISQTLITDKLFTEMFITLTVITQLLIYGWTITYTSKHSDVEDIYQILKSCGVRRLSDRKQQFWDPEENQLLEEVDGWPA